MGNEEKEEIYSLEFISFSVFFFIVVYVLLSGFYKLPIASKVFLSSISLFSLFIFRKKGIDEFSVSFLAGIFIFLAIEISFNLNVFFIFFISLASSFLIFYTYTNSKSEHKHPLMLLGLFLVILGILGFNAHYRDVWIAENILTVLFVLLIVLTYSKMRVSNFSYNLVFIYLLLHIIGSHYTYSEVPFGVWMQSFFSSGRNHYDRIVHFSFGFLLAYPIMEVFRKISNTRGFLNYYIPVEFVLAFSCIYEIIEWLIAVIFGGDLGIAYLGAQGDIWDAQKDMALAGLGATISMTIAFFLRKKDKRVEEYLGKK